MYVRMYGPKSRRPHCPFFFASFSRPVRSIATRCLATENSVKVILSGTLARELADGRAGAGTQTFLPSRFLMRLPPPESDVGECAGC